MMITDVFPPSSGPAAADVRRPPAADGARRRPARGLLVLAAAGKQWRLYWPRALWETLTGAERAAVAERQAALLRQNETE